jgi:hypothetical protein
MRIESCGQLTADETDRGKKSIEQSTAEFLEEHMEEYAKEKPTMTARCLVLSARY